LSRHELLRVEAALTSEANELDQLKDRLATAQKSLDVDIQKTTLQQETRPQWHLILATVSCILSPVGPWYFSPVEISVCYIALFARR
jgi:hypothetical protein